MAAATDEPLVNKTIRAVVMIIMIIFCMGTVVWLIMHGQAANSLHASALSWSYTLMLVCAAALGLDLAVATILAQKK